MVNERLRTARLIARLTQHQLAQKAGLREWNISRIETGRAEPTDEERKRIAAILGKKTYELF